MRTFIVLIHEFKRHCGIMSEINTPHKQAFSNGDDVEIPTQFHLETDIDANEVTETKLETNGKGRSCSQSCLLPILQKT